MTEECSICFEDMDEATKINKCGHAFHHDCIKEWTEINQSCPICREDTAPQFVQKDSLSDNYTNSMDLPWRHISVRSYFSCRGGTHLPTLAQRRIIRGKSNGLTAALTCCTERFRRVSAHAARTRGNRAGVAGKQHSTDRRKTSNIDRDH